MCVVRRRRRWWDVNGCIRTNRTILFTFTWNSARIVRAPCTSERQCVLQKKMIKYERRKNKLVWRIAQMSNSVVRSWILNEIRANVRAQHTWLHISYLGGQLLLLPPPSCWFADTHTSRWSRTSERSCSYSSWAYCCEHLSQREHSN